jgi:threonine dehydrogenase-like Zn-dependent dehydrogenase
MLTTKAFAAQRAGTTLGPFSFERREPGPHDVAIDISHCGVCHTDIHFVRNDWGMSIYPTVPGHEIIGRVADVGSHVKKLQPGDPAAVGCLVDSCRECPSSRPLQGGHRPRYVAHRLRCAQPPHHVPGQTDARSGRSRFLRRPRGERQRPVKVLGEPTLKDIARELVIAVKANVTIDWSVREHVRAQLRVLVTGEGDPDGA